VGSMLYPRFLGFSILGATLWVLLFVLGGYFFGNLPIVKENFTLVILMIIVLSVLPSVVEVIRMRLRKTRTNAG